MVAEPAGRTPGQCGPAAGWRAGEHLSPV